MGFDKRHSDWYRQCDPDVSEERFTKRQQALEEFATQAELETALDAVRLFFDIEPKLDGFEDAFREVFAKSDAVFPASGNKQEMKILAGMAAHHYARHKSGRSNKIEIDLAFVTSHCKTAGPLFPVLEIVQDSQNDLIAASSALRSGQSLIRPTKSNLRAKVITDVMRDGASLVDHHQVATKAADGIDMLAGSIRSATAQLPSMFDAFQMLQEEINILWWLFGERSHSDNSSFSAHPPGAVCFMGAFDLAELTQFRPGPLSSEAFLMRVVGLSKGKKPNKISLSDAVGQCSVGWAKMVHQNLEGNEGLLDLCPLHYCLCEYAKVDGDDAWVTLATKNASVSLKSTFSLGDLTLQAYQEQLLLRTNLG